VAGVVERRAGGVQRLRGDEVAAADDAERVAHAERGEGAPDGLGGVHAAHGTGPRAAVGVP
jgi:hypothetical protein